MHASERLAGLTVCVDYSDHLSKSLAKWQAGLDELLVVTAPRDEATQELCRVLGVRVHLTDVFWDRGALFNKGAAIAEAWRTLAPSDWRLLFDADIEPPEDWRTAIGDLEPGFLYGAPRFDAVSGGQIGDPNPCGWFLIAHAADPNLQRDPVVDDHWAHAGGYDTTLMERWPRERRRWLPLKVLHHGETWKNWCGVGNDEAMRQLLAERRRRGGRYDHETV